MLLFAPLILAAIGMSCPAAAVNTGLWIIEIVLAYELIAKSAKKNVRAFFNGFSNKRPPRT